LEQTIYIENMPGQILSKDEAHVLAVKYVDYIEQLLNKYWGVNFGLKNVLRWLDKKGIHLELTITERKRLLRAILEELRRRGLEVEEKRGINRSRRFIVRRPGASRLIAAMG